MRSASSASPELKLLLELLRREKAGAGGGSSIGFSLSLSGRESTLIVESVALC